MCDRVVVRDERILRYADVRRERPAVLLGRCRNRMRHRTHLFGRHVRADAGLRSAGATVLPEFLMREWVLLRFLQQLS
jgi:hypothetical protein